MKQSFRSQAALALTCLALLAACDGSSDDGSGNAGVGEDRLQLRNVQYGRLVDVYAYRRVDPNNTSSSYTDRRNRLFRQEVLVAKDVLVDPLIESQSLFDPAGNEVGNADYQFLPFDTTTGHEALLILWDDRLEATSFQSALSFATSNLMTLPDAYRGQNTVQRPIPVAPRNGAFQLNFSGNLSLPANFFEVNPSAIQLLEFKGDPSVVPPNQAFRALPFRPIVKQRAIILDTTILGQEAGGGQNVPGMPPSVDNVTANIRIAIPSRGGASSQFFVPADTIEALNDVDSFGRDSVIRDFRSGNPSDGRFGAISDAEPPMIVANLGMGITAIDPVNNLVTLNKRGLQVPVRARYPMVEGPIDPATGYPRGPVQVPVVTPLRAGDRLTQVVNVAMPDGSTEAVRVSAEILQNMEVGTVLNDPAFPALARAADGTQGENLNFIRVKFATVSPGVDSLGRPVRFVANDFIDGQDCVVRCYYYENVRFTDGSGSVSDALRRGTYVNIDPTPVGAVTPGTLVDTFSSISVSFSEPVDLDDIDVTKNFLLTNSTITGANFAELINRPKPASLSVVATSFSDQSGDGTTLQLTPPLGHFHVNGTAESYWFHILLGTTGVTDLAGNPIAVYADPSLPVSNWSFNYTLNGANPTNRVGWRISRFEDVDEDGTPPGTVDLFGQYRLQNGSLVAAETIRFSRTADNQNLGGISRVNRGECWVPGTAQTAGAQAPFDPNSPQNGGLLYWQPRMFDINPTPPQVFLPPNTPHVVGEVVEPLQPRGSRMMMRYLEDDFSLSYRQPSEFLLDVDQLYWSPFNDNNVLFDVFDRFSMSLAHGDKRPDERWSLVTAGTPPATRCTFDCVSVSSNLSSAFEDNVLRGSAAVKVLEDRVYQINPNQAFRAPTGTKFVPYPRFQRSYTWRDSRLVTTDGSGNISGLGGARDPSAQPPNNDSTCNIDSPWIRDNRYTDFPGSVWVMDIHSNALPNSATGDGLGGDFIGTRLRDHDPIALPLLMDIKVFPDGAANGVATASNMFQVAMLGPPSNFLLGNPGGYYNSVGVGCAGRLPWPWTRIHTTGGLDPTTGQNILVDPANTQTAQGGWLKDAGLGDPIQGLFFAPPGDGHLHWAQADFVRKVSTVTMGFFDTLQPNRQNIGASAAGSWPGLGVAAGFPNLEALQGTGTLRVSEVVTLTDPPVNRQPAGTSVVVEFRGAESFENATIYDSLTQDQLRLRGNLLNPNYACEAFRYSVPNSGPAGDRSRIIAAGLTPYVTQDRLGNIRNPLSGLLPRYMNLRLTMTNNVTVTPALSPSLRNLMLVYRVQNQ